MSLKTKVAKELVNKYGDTHHFDFYNLFLFAVDKECCSKMLTIRVEILTEPFVFQDALYTVNTDYKPVRYKFLKEDDLKKYIKVQNEEKLTEETGLDVKFMDIDLEAMWEDIKKISNELATGLFNELKNKGLVTIFKKGGETL